MLSFFRAYFKQMSAKTVEYHNCSKFSAEIFLHELNQDFNKSIIYISQDRQYDLYNMYN